MNEPLVYLNGAFVPLSWARVSVLDNGFLYGDGLFETMRSYRGKVPALDRHLRRLRTGLDALRIPLPKELDGMPELIREVLRANSLLDADARLRLTVTSGEGTGTPRFSRESPPTVLITAFMLPPADPAEFESGYRAMISVRIRRNHLSPISTLKSLNYLESLLAKAEAREREVEECILLNAAGYVAEGSTSNVFLVKGGRLITPSSDSGILPGITREVLIEIASRMGIPSDERWVRPKELFAADECFLTNSIIELMPLVEVDGRRIGEGRPGPLTRELAASYRRLVSLAQIQP